MRLTHILKTKKYRYLLVGGVVLLLVVVGMILSMRPKAGPSIIGKDDGTVLTDYSGKDVRFDQFTSILHRKPLIVYFWATWCSYCTAEFAQLSGANSLYGDNVEILAVNRGESVQDAKQYTDKLPTQDGLVFLLDSKDMLFKKLGGYAMPETIFINTHGEEVFHKHGPISAAEIETATKSIIK